LEEPEGIGFFHGGCVSNEVSDLFKKPNFS